MLLNAYISPRTKNYDFFVQNAENKKFFKNLTCVFCPIKSAFLTLSLERKFDKMNFLIYNINIMNHVGKILENFRNY